MIGIGDDVHDIVDDGVRKIRIQSLGQAIVQDCNSVVVPTSQFSIRLSATSSLDSSTVEATVSGSVLFSEVSTMLARKPCDIGNDVQRDVGRDPPSFRRMHTDRALVR